MPVVPLPVRSSIWKRQVLVVLAFLAADLIALSLSVGIAAGVRQTFSYTMGFLFTEPLLQVLPLCLTYFVAYAVAGLYPSFGLTPEQERRRAASATLATTIVLGMAMFLGRMTSVSRFVFIGAGLCAVLLVPLGRALMHFAFARRDWWNKPVAVIGNVRDAAALIRALRARPGLGYKPVAVLLPTPSNVEVVHSVRVLGTVEEAGHRMAEHGIKHALIAMGNPARGRIGRLVARAEQHFARITIVPYFFRLNQYQLEPRDLNGIVGLETHQPLANPYWARGKRVFDVIVTLAAMPAALPIILFAALIVRLDSKGPAFYCQERLGKNGKRFKLIKLRTMHSDAHERLKQLLDSSPELAREYDRLHKLKDDPRITRVGGFLRVSSIDELPQLFNVLKGDMSLVGPRPYMPDEEQAMAGVQRVILMVRPGITGYWQTFDRNRASFHKRLQMDVHYVRNWSPAIDLFLIVRTIGVLLRPRNAH